MNLLHISKITEKLTWLQVTLIVGFIIIGAAYFAVVRVGTDAAVRTTHLTAFKLKIENAKRGILEARRRRTSTPDAWPVSRRDSPICWRLRPCREKSRSG